jgi:hypothetical protein
MLQWLGGVVEVEGKMVGYLINPQTSNNPLYNLPHISGIRYPFHSRHPLTINTDKVYFT